MVCMSNPGCGHDLIVWVHAARCKVAGLETVLALRELIGSSVAITLLTPDAEFVSVAQAVRQAFGGRRASRRRISQFASEFGVKYCQVSLHEVDATAHVLTTSAGERIGYDKLVIAVGARHEAAFEHVLTYDASAASVEAIHGLVQDVEDGYTKRIAFVVPAGVVWPLPLYELALMLSTRAREMCVDAELTLLTPETAPLAIFGTEASEAVRVLLDEAGIGIETGVEATIARLKTSDPHMLQHMLDRGFILNARVRIVERDPFSGPLTVRVDGKRRVIGHQVAENVLVSTD